MNDPKSWDPSLAKKFSSSNHYKLLNQLRNEVKKYPLNYKKRNSSISSKVTNLENKDKLDDSYTQNKSLSNNSNLINDVNSNKTNVSFNNSKNFSIYNHINNNIKEKNDSFISDTLKSNDESSSQSFKERLNQIDMK